MIARQKHGLNYVLEHNNEAHISVCWLNCWYALFSYCPFACLLVRLFVVGVVCVCVLCILGWTYIVVALYQEGSYRQASVLVHSVGQRSFSFKHGGQGSYISEPLRILGPMRHLLTNRCNQNVKGSLKCLRFRRPDYCMSHVRTG